MNKQEVIKFNATGKIFGRLATEVATILRGKRTVGFRPNLNPGIKVEVSNIENIKFSGTKMTTRQYHSFSGYPGGLKTTTLKQKFEKNPIELFRQAVIHMLPKNRLSSVIIKNLTIKKGE